MAVRKRDGGWEACSAPSEDTDSDAAKAFGLIAHAIITLYYRENSGGAGSLLIWADVGDFVGKLLKEFLVRFNGASAQAIDNYYATTGMAKTVPDLIDARFGVWYEIKPASKTGYREAALKKANIGKFLAAIGLAGIYTPGKPSKATNGRVNLLPKMPPGFAPFLQMQTARLGGIAEIKVELVFRCGEPMIVAGAPDLGWGIIVYRICVNVKFNDDDKDHAEAYASMAQNIARWTTIFIMRAAGGKALDGNKPLTIQLDKDENDEQIKRLFRPDEALLVSSILRAPPSERYSVCGGALAQKALAIDMANQRFLANVFRLAPTPELKWTQDSAEIWAMASLAGQAIILLSMVVVAFPELLAFGKAAAEKITTSTKTLRAVEKMAQDGGKATNVGKDVGTAGNAWKVESVAENAARTARENQLRTVGTAAFRQAATKAGAIGAGMVSGVLCVVGSYTDARAAEQGLGQPSIPSIDDRDLAQQATSAILQQSPLDVVQLVAWQRLTGLGPTTPVQGANGPGVTPKQRENVSGSGLTDAILLYTVAVKDLPELNIPFFDSFPSDT